MELFENCRGSWPGKLLEKRNAARSIRCAWQTAVQLDMYSVFYLADGMESSRPRETRFEHAYHPILLLTRVHTFELHLDPVQRTGCCFMRVSLHNHVMHNLILTNLLRPLVRVRIDTRLRLMNSLCSNQMSESSLARFSSSESMFSRYFLTEIMFPLDIQLRELSPAWTILFRDPSLYPLIIWKETR